MGSKQNNADKWFESTNRNLVPYKHLNAPEE